MSQPLVITHRDCFDGHTAAWIYSRFVNRNAEFVAARHGDKPPDVAGRDVVIADFSYPRATMLQIAAQAKSLRVFDHHATARDALAGLEKEVLDTYGKAIGIVFDMERSGCGIVWDYFVNPNARPVLVSQVEGRDLWKAALFDEDYMSVVYAAEMTFESWDELHSKTFPEIAADGRAIRRYVRQYGTKALAEARKRSIYGRGRGGPESAGIFCWTVNLPYMNCSDHLSRLMIEKDADFVVGYFCRGDGRWQFSLRSRSGFDCSEVAKAFGGGGHKEASGFDVASLDEVFV